MLIKDYLESCDQIIIPDDSPQFIYESASLLAEFSGDKPITSDSKIAAAGSLKLNNYKYLNDQAVIREDTHGEIPENFIWIRIDPLGISWIITSHSHYLFSFCHNIIENWLGRDISAFADGKFIVPSFIWHRTAYDYFLTQEGRICRDFNRESHIRQLAKNGFTHLEVNGLAYPMGLEDGPKGETYPMFYTYCPALDQFVYSDLNKGLYPHYYLEANLKYLKENAQLAIKYGLVPGLLCFEPRSVPEAFFQKYPMLRGARVDHPFRSFKPRYNMTITHPKVRAHYTQMLDKLMSEVPELGFLNIWTNDSGAGFEHTKSLYVGRNGGAYLIREWKNDDEIARLAGENALRFFRTLREAGRNINPDFRVITRMESFYGEHDVINEGLGDQLDIECSSLVQRGWDMPYHHPKYPEQFDINGGSVYQRDFVKEEARKIIDLKNKGCNTSIYFGYGPQVMFAPLLGIPYPWLTHERLKQLADEGVEYLSHMGGSVQAEYAPFNINHDIINAFQYDKSLNPDYFIVNYAIKHAGEKHAKILTEAWKLIEKAILAFPNVSSLYSTIGFSWYRLWVRPLVPDIEAIPQKDRDYYENFMCTTPHNPNNVDLSRDILFKLIPEDKAGFLVDMIDRNVWKHIDKAIDLLEDFSGGILYDQKIRMKALRCWILTQRNIAAWINISYAYLGESSKDLRKNLMAEMQTVIRSEMSNTEDLLDLISSGVNFMAITDKGETPLVYGDNIEELLNRRLALMTRHIMDEPFIDHDYIERKAGEPII